MPLWCALVCAWVALGCFLWLWLAVGRCGWVVVVARVRVRVVSAVVRAGVRVGSRGLLLLVCVVVRVRFVQVRLKCLRLAVVACGVGVGGPWLLCAILPWGLRNSERRKISLIW